MLPGDYRRGAPFQGRFQTFAATAYCKPMVIELDEARLAERQLEGYSLGNSSGYHD
jgi:hypothetical protein